MPSWDWCRLQVVHDRAHNGTLQWLKEQGGSQLWICYSESRLPCLRCFRGWSGGSIRNSCSKQPNSLAPQHDLIWFVHLQGEVQLSGEEFAFSILISWWAERRSSCNWLLATLSHPSCAQFLFIRDRYWTWFLASRAGITSWAMRIDWHLLYRSITTR